MKSELNANQHDKNFCCFNVVKVSKVLYCASNSSLRPWPRPIFIPVVWQHLVLLWQSCQGMRLACARQTERTGRDDMQGPRKRSECIMIKRAQYRGRVSITQSVTRTHQVHSIRHIIIAVLIHTWYTNRQRKTYAQVYEENCALF